MSHGLACEEHYWNQRDFICYHSRELKKYQFKYLLQPNTVVQAGDMETDEIQIQKRIRQGCVLSPQLFNLYSQFVFWKALEDRHEEVNMKVNITT